MSYTSKISLTNPNGETIKLNSIIDDVILFQEDVEECVSENELLKTVIHHIKRKKRNDLKIAKDTKTHTRLSFTENGELLYLIAFK